ncbi:MAG: HD domain-containing protein [Spirochaetia bacterium]|nr:HD domain-containing protein [Spirochaetia bacterium]
MKLENHIDSKTLEKRMYPRVEDIRGYFFRDLTAIIHSYPYRRLKHKTQVFFAPHNDHICTRMEHVMHVATISVTICKALNLDTDLAWAISVGHDLGHTPFGHTGESILSKYLEKQGGFCHEIYSLRVVDHLINSGKGLNLTYAVRDGIINHCGEKFEQYLEPASDPCVPEEVHARNCYPCTWEGIAVRMSDKIAYLGRDLEDALRLGVVKEHDVPAIVTRVLGGGNSSMINTMVCDAVESAEKLGKIGFSDPVYEAMVALKKFNYEHIYQSQELIKYDQRIHRLIDTLWEYLSEIFDRYGFDYAGYDSEMTNVATEFAGYLRKMEAFYRTEADFSYVIPDYIAGMTDKFAIDSAVELLSPQQFSYNF